MLFDNVRYFWKFQKKYVNYESIKLKYVKFEINLSADVKAVYFHKIIIIWFYLILFGFLVLASVNK